MADIGFIGLGHMGLPMAINLVKKGHHVTGFDLQTTAMESFQENGGRIATHIDEVALNKSLVITMLQTGEQVHSLCLGETGLFNKMSPGALFVDCSTIGVDAARQFHEAAQKKGLLSLDAPVSGGVSGATKGTLTLMVGGSLDTFEKAKPILSAIGAKLIYTGEAGSGQAAKLCNNMILGISMIAVSEAFLLGERLGLSHQKLFEVVTQSSGQCWVMSQNTPVPHVNPSSPASFNYQAGFSTLMMQKDLTLSQKAAQSVGINTILGATAAQMYTQVKEKIGNLDFSAIMTCLSELEIEQ